jgi:hypothetical protein
MFGPDRIGVVLGHAAFRHKPDPRIGVLDRHREN